jgi:hypothetical protein
MCSIVKCLAKVRSAAGDRCESVMHARAILMATGANAINTMLYPKLHFNFIRDVLTGWNFTDPQACDIFEATPQFCIIWCHRFGV